MTETVKEDFEEIMKPEPSPFLDYILFPFIIGCSVFGGLFVLGFGGMFVYEIIIEYDLYPLIALGLLIISIWAIGFIVLYGIFKSGENTD